MDKPVLSLFLKNGFHPLHETRTVVAYRPQATYHTLAPTKHYPDTARSVYLVSLEDRVWRNKLKPFIFDQLVCLLSRTPSIYCVLDTPISIHMNWLVILSDNSAQLLFCVQSFNVAI